MDKICICKRPDWTTVVIVPGDIHTNTSCYKKCSKCGGVDKAEPKPACDLHLLGVGNKCVKCGEIFSVESVDGIDPKIGECKKECDHIVGVNTGDGRNEESGWILRLSDLKEPKYPWFTMDRLDEVFKHCPECGEKLNLKKDE